LGNDLSMLFPEQSRENSIRRIEDAIKGEKWVSVEIPIQNKSGEVRTALWNSANIYSQSGELQAVIAQGQDITERKRVEEILARSEEKFKKAFVTSPDSVSINRLSDGMFVSINKGFTQISGYTEEETIGKTSLEINIWKNPVDRKNIVDELLARGEVRDYEVSFLTKKGEIDGLMFASIIELNGVPHILNITRDITERKKAERALRESEEKYHTLYNNMQEDVALHELVYDEMGQAVEYKIIDVNPKFVSILHLAKDFVINKLSTQAYGTSLPPYLAQYSAVAQSGIPYHFETYFPSLDKHFEISVSPWGSNGFATIFSDITGRKHAQEELSRYARRLIIINRMDRVVTSSLDIEQVYDRFVEDLRELVHIDRTSIVLLDESREHWTVAMIWTGYKPIIGKGECRVVKGSAIEWIVNQKLPLVESEIGEKGDWAENEPLRQEKIRSRVLLPLIIRDEVVGVLSLASRHPAAFSEKDLEILIPLADQFSLALQNSRLYDRLKQQSLQLEKTVEERTAQLQKANDELEAFSYSVSHDLRSPLRAVDGFSRILLEEHLAELSPDARHYLDLVRSNAVQMGQLIDDLLTFSRTSRQPLAKRLVNPAEVVEQVLEELQGELQGRNVEVNVGDLLPCRADPAMLRRVFFNLISNAVKYTRKKEESRIDIGSINNEGMVTYFVKDNGVGFDMRYSGKLFGVFSRLHSESDYEGTGVGLAIVARIVHRHGGSVWAEADVGKGAAFYFTLGGSESL
jgi:PAS domain S-box-containing protein